MGRASEKGKERKLMACMKDRDEDGRVKGEESVLFFLFFLCAACGVVS